MQDFREMLHGLMSDERGDLYVAYADGSRNLLPAYTAEEVNDCRLQIEKNIALIQELESEEED